MTSTKIYPWGTPHLRAYVMGNIAVLSSLNILERYKKGDDKITPAMLEAADIQIAVSRANADKTLAHVPLSVMIQVVNQKDKKVSFVRHTYSEMTKAMKDLVDLGYTIDGWFPINFKSTKEFNEYLTKAAASIWPSKLVNA